MNFFINNFGILRYLDVYKVYSDFLTHKAEQDINAFLKEPHELDAFELQIKRLKKIREEIILSRLSIPLNFYCLEAHKFHDDLGDRVQRLKDKLVQFCVDQNRDLNKTLIKILKN